MAQWEKTKKTPIQYHKTEQKDEINIKKEINAGNSDKEDQSEELAETVQKSTLKKIKISKVKNIHTVMEGESLWSIALKI